MYVRPQGYKYQSEVRLPENYSGNTFREPIEAEEMTEDESVETASVEESVQDVDSVEKDTAQAAALLPKSNFKLRLGSLFGGNKGGIGTEELLILALVLLLADSEGNDDLILFLVLLFFIK